MKITKFAQSCIMIEHNDEKILIDPGVIFTKEETIQKWMNPNYILVTHKHQDHFDEETVKKIIGSSTSIYSSHEVADAYQDIKFFTTHENNLMLMGGLEVQVTKAIHGYTPLLKGGKEINEGLGFIIDDGQKTIYHTGDTISFQNKIACNVILLPFNNHGLVMGPFEAALFAKETGANIIIPMHYDNPKFPGDKQKLDEELAKNGLKAKWLNVGESIEV